AHVSGLRRNEARLRRKARFLQESARSRPRRNATIADLQRSKNAGELRSETEPELLNDAIFGAIYYRMLLHSGPLTRRFGEELVEHILRGHGSGPGRGRSD